MVTHWFAPLTRGEATPASSGGSGGFTLIELLVALAIVALMLSIVAPNYFGNLARADEAVLRENLYQLRDAIDKHFGDTGRYPASLDELTNKRYLRAIPKDPLTHSPTTWILIPPPTRSSGASTTSRAAPRANPATALPMRSGSRQRGFTYLAALLLIALTGAALGAFAEAWSHARQREREAELIWVGNQFKEAIGLYYQRSPGSVKRYPEKLEDLLEDKRHLTVQRYIRKIYADPLTGKADWEPIAAPEGGIIGVKSTSATASIRSPEYGWRFVYEPPIRKSP